MFIRQVAGPTALAVSRAIGDILMKEPRKLVISDPEIKTIDLVPQVGAVSVSISVCVCACACEYIASFLLKRPRCCLCPPTLFCVWCA